MAFPLTGKKRCALDGRSAGPGQRLRLKEERRQTVCKPGSVQGRSRARYGGCPPSLTRVRPLYGHSSGTPVTGRLARPTRGSVRKSTCPDFSGPALLSGLAPGGVCRAASVAGRAVRSYRTVSPLPFSKERRFAFCGTVPRLDARRTLSGTVFPWSPDFPPSSHCWGKSGHPTIWLGRGGRRLGCRSQALAKNGARLRRTRSSTFSPAGGRSNLAPVIIS